MPPFDFQRGVVSAVQAAAAYREDVASKDISKLAGSLLELFEDGDVSFRDRQRLFKSVEELVAKIEAIDSRLKRIEHLLVNRS
jgi:hypothetical protein